MGLATFIGSCYGVSERVTTILPNLSDSRSNSVEALKLLSLDTFRSFSEIRLKIIIQKNYNNLIINNFSSDLARLKAISTYESDNLYVVV